MSDCTSEYAPEEVLRATASALESDLLVVTRHQQIRYVSPSLAGLLGYDEDELTGEQLGEYVHDTDADEVDTLVQKPGTDGGARNGSFRIERADGSYRCLEVTVSELTQTDSERYALEVWDVTEHRQKEQQLEAFADLLEQLHEVTNRLYASNSVDEALGTVRDAAVEILGFDWCILAEADDGTFVIRTTSDGAPLSVGDKPLDTDEGAAGTAYQTGASKLVDDTDQSGISEPTHEFINSSVAVPVGSWGVFQALSTSQNAFDTQDRQLAETLVAPLATTIERFEQEKQLRDSKTTQQRQRQQIEAIHAVATEMKTVKTREEIYEMTIDAVEEILSFDICIVDEREGDVLVPKAVGSDMSIEDYYEETPIQSSDNLGSETYRTGETFVIDDLHEAGYAPAQSTYKSCISIPLGGWGIFQAAAKVEAIFDETDRRLVELLTEHTVAAVERIEREQELERRAAELERQNERLEQFASIVSHDLQNPLNVAMGYTDQTLATGETEYVENISDALDRMETIINDVLTLAKQGETVGNRETVALTDLIEDSWRQVPSETASLTVADEGTVEGDPSRLAQLFENLFRNSVEHGSTSSRTASDDSVEHGSTSSRAGPDDSVEHGSTNSRTASDDSVEHSSTSSRAEPDDSVEHAGPEVEIEVGLLDDRDGLYVEDDGSGIDEAQRDRIFDHGYTDSDDGTGFGLSIVRQIVEAHGWEIAVTDSQTGGARFEITGVDVDS